MKTYKIPCTWQMYGYYHIEAENIKEALQKAEDADLPENGEYIEMPEENDEIIIEDVEENYMEYDA